MIPQQPQVTQEEIDKVWGNASFGSSSRMDIVKYGLLKCASGWQQGYTATCILRDLGLITKNYKLTERGRKNLWNFFENPNVNT